MPLVEVAIICNSDNDSDKDTEDLGIKKPMNFDIRNWQVSKINVVQASKFQKISGSVSLTKQEIAKYT